LSRTIIDYHVIQTVPPSNINRDDTGSPKTATYGGTRRARVSSQAWKRAIRDAFDRKLLDREQLGVRTKRLLEIVGDEVASQAPDLADRRHALARAAVEAAGFKLKAPRRKDGALDEAEFLVFLSRQQIINLAALAVEAARTAADGALTINKAEAKARSDRDHSVDVSLFGRMVANLPDLNVEASVQVAHALSVHAVTNEYDFFTAVDDHKRTNEDEDAGAGMMGTVEFNSSTLYRYAALDADQLQRNLGDVTATRLAIDAFTRAFVTSMPTGKQNTFAHGTLPDVVLIVVRETLPINLVGAFESPVSDKTGRVAAAIERLAEHAIALHEAYDETPVAAWTFGPGQPVQPLTRLAGRTTIDAAVRDLAALVTQRLAP
jgi:CRISPR system Cascade subunit CasC